MSFNEWGIIVAAIGVVVGVILEGWEHWNDFKTKGWKPLSPKVGFAVLVISLAVEIVFDARLAKESADTQLEAARIEAAVAWRVLTTKQQRQLATSLKPFAGQSVNFIVYAGDLEAWFFSDQIEVSLGYLHRAPWAAGWNVHFGRITWSPREATGLLIETTPTASDKDRDAANALARALASQQIRVGGPMVRGKEMEREAVSGDLDTKAPIIVTVGVHPPPPFEP